ncbi:tRNA (adenosine(37)-N6)-threonylcarbamoyltransferase complex dimerization subunit type 1 TsaB [bacterium]|nr:tRNA (adenosine(37)-N6)-threonylcarbamoyltransferase complex dimerization subunit type 1 TsaB [bacterium]|tara:strand:+ start:379 stop:813 length:435 start_codon:yes stop_codon:yes gene_type:complete
MILVIDTTSGSRVELFLFARGTLLRKSKRSKFRQSEVLLPLIDDFLRKFKVDKCELQRIGVVQGPGPFTATRVGVTVANSLGFCLSIPVIGLSGAMKQDPAKMIKAVEKDRGRVDSSVHPIYDKEPNIAVKKKRLFAIMSSKRG